MIKWRNRIGIAIALSTIVVLGELRGLYLALTVSVAAIFSVGVAPLTVSSLSTLLGGPAMIGQSLAIVCGATSALGAIVFALGTRYFPTSARDVRVYA